ncbi:hypothetical protein B0H13DRAFT_2566271 [Mycena leptocephala]|nr:hypothetical protein B0H13DRAFT_2566271 [Mycena leptocephala]
MNATRPCLPSHPLRLPFTVSRLLSGPLRRLHSACLCPGPHSASVHGPIPPPTAPLRCIQPCTWLLGRLPRALPPPAHTLRLRRAPPPHAQYAPQPFPIEHGGYVQYPLPSTILSTPMAPFLPVMHTDDAAMKLSDRVRRRCFSCCTTDTTNMQQSARTRVRLQGGSPTNAVLLLLLRWRSSSVKGKGKQEDLDASTTAGSVHLFPSLWSSAHSRIRVDVRELGSGSPPQSLQLPPPLRARAPSIHPAIPPLRRKSLRSR